MLTGIGLLFSLPAWNMPVELPRQVLRSRRHDTDNLESRAARAEALVHMGELSAARQALGGAAVAPGTRDTLNALQDPERRPPVLLPPDILHAGPVEQFSLDFDVSGVPGVALQVDLQG